MGDFEFGDETFFFGEDVDTEFVFIEWDSPNVGEVLYFAKFLGEKIDDSGNIIVVCLLGIFLGLGHGLH